MTLPHASTHQVPSARRGRRLRRVVAVIAAVVSIVGSVPTLALAETATTSTAVSASAFGAVAASLDLPAALGLRDAGEVLLAGSPWETRAPISPEGVGIGSIDITGRPSSPPRLTLSPGLNATIFTKASPSSIAAGRTTTDLSRLVVSPSPSPGAPNDDELASFSPCGNPYNVSEQARAEVVEAFGALCRDAAADGVSLMISSAYRSAAIQRDLFRAAVRKYGSRKEAARWVARPAADGSCTSKHCGGIAIDLADYSGNLAKRGPVIDWISEPVGCLSDDGFLELPECDDSEEPVLRFQLYGFIRPMPYEPWHIELGLPFEPNPLRLDRTTVTTFGTAVAHDAPLTAR